MTSKGSVGRDRRGRDGSDEVWWRRDVGDLSTAKRDRRYQEPKGGDLGAARNSGVVSKLEPSSRGSPGSLGSLGSLLRCGNRLCSS